MAGPTINTQPAAIGQFASIGDIVALGTTQLTELAHTYEQFHGDPLAKFYTKRTVNNNVIMMERIRRGLGIAPLVTLGGNDVITDGMTVEQRAVTPFATRESDFIPDYIVQMLREPGTTNTLWGEQMVAERVQRLVQRQNFFWQVMRTKLLADGIIAYTDPRTGAAISLDAGIPSTNVKDVSGTPATDFADLVNCKPVSVIRFFKALIRNMAKATPKYIVMASELRDILTLNPEVVARQEGFGGGPITQFVQFNNGDLTHIAGLEIITIDTIYEDPVTKVKRKVWPIEWVTLLVDAHPETPGVTLGREDHCLGEGPTPGMWMRDGGPTLPPAAPGRAIQIGDAGVPYIMYPEWVGRLKVSTAAALNALIDQTKI